MKVRVHDDELYPVQHVYVVKDQTPIPEHWTVEEVPDEVVEAYARTGKAFQAASAALTVALGGQPGGWEEDADEFVSEWGQH